MFKTPTALLTEIKQSSKDIVSSNKHLDHGMRSRLKAIRIRPHCCSTLQTKSANKG